jgi:predicted amidohydrolase YtcJ
MAALEGYTTAAARAVCEHDRSGRVAVGYRADLTALAADPVEVGADDLPDVDVALTVVDGAVVYRRA